MFKFHIGAMVMHKSGIADAVMQAKLFGVQSYPKTGIIIDRVMTEHTGGTRLQYKVGFDGENDSYASEVELIATHEFDLNVIRNAIDEFEILYQAKVEKENEQGEQ